VLKFSLRNRVSRLILSCALAAGLSLVMVPGLASAAGLTVDQIIQMHKAGLPGAVITQTIQSTGATFNLSVSDVKKLKKAGVSSGVIDAMTASAGSAAPAPEPAPAGDSSGEPDELKSLQAQEAAERGRIEEEARIREAGRRAADKERKRMVAEERRRIAAALQSARDALADGQYAVASVQFDKFLKKADPRKTTTWDAKLGMAKALYGLGLYGNAAERFHDVLSAGAEHPAFVPAFNGLRNCAKRIAYNPVTLEGLTKYFVGDKKTKFQNSYHYFVGKFFFDYNRNEEAKTYLDKVTSKGSDYADAQYLRGLIGVAEAEYNKDDETSYGRLARVTPYFQRAVTAGEVSGAFRIAHLAYLALARIAYTVGAYDVAIFYYRKIPYDSTSYVNALHESGWSYFLKGDSRRGLGIFHTLEGPDWEGEFLPDVHLLEATVFMNNCHFEYAHAALKRIDTGFLALKNPLTKFMTEYADPQALYKAFVLKQGKAGVNLPVRLRQAVISNPEFYDLYTSVTQYRREVVRVERVGQTLGSDLSARLLQTVEAQKLNGAIALGLKINQILQTLSDELDELEVKKTEIQIEIDSTAADELEKSIEQTYQGKSELQQSASAEATASIFVGDLYVTWPFEGEFWADEINSYRSDVKEVCKQ
jgi:tetratricopeptide (TPR) repeat protein